MKHSFAQQFPLFLQKSTTRVYCNYTTTAAANHLYAGILLYCIMALFEFNYTLSDKHANTIQPPPHRDRERDRQGVRLEASCRTEQNEMWQYESVVPEYVCVRVGRSTSFLTGGAV